MPINHNHSVRARDSGLRTGDVPALLREPGGFHRLRAALSEMRAAFPPGSACDDAPPWLLCPGLPRASIGWQTGQGHATLTRFAAAYRASTVPARADLRRRFPEPDGWHGYYDSLG